MCGKPHTYARVAFLKRARTRPFGWTESCWRLMAAATVRVQVACTVPTYHVGTTQRQRPILPLAFRAAGAQHPFPVHTPKYHVEAPRLHTVVYMFQRQGSAVWDDKCLGNILFQASHICMVTTIARATEFMGLWMFYRSLTAVQRNGRRNHIYMVSCHSVRLVITPFIMMYALWFWGLV